MNKAELAEKVAGRMGITRLEASNIVDEVVGAISDTIQKREDVRLPNLGYFTVSKRAKRKARNPRTGDEITVPAKWVVKFKPAKGVADGMN